MPGSQVSECGPGSRSCWSPQLHGAVLPWPGPGVGNLAQWQRAGKAVLRVPVSLAGVGVKGAARLDLGLRSSCSCCRQGMAASADAPACAPSLAIPGCPEFTSSCAVSRAASHRCPSARPSGEHPQSLQTRGSPTPAAGGRLPAYLWCRGARLHAPMPPPLPLGGKLAEIAVKVLLRPQPTMMEWRGVRAVSFCWYF